MTDPQWYLKNEPAPSLRYWVASQMTKGAIYAFFACMAVFAFVLVFKAIGGLLPPESKQAPDPSASLIIVAPEPDATRTA